MNKKHITVALLALTFVSAGAQEITTESKVIDCGQVVFKHPVTAEFEMKNSGGQPLTITNVRTSCGCTTVSYPQNAIPAGATFTVSATYDAKQMGHFDKQIGIYSNASGDPTILSVRGVVVGEIVDFQGEYPYQMGDLAVDANDIEFDNVNRGDHPFQKIHIKNNGTKTAEPVIMHLPDYLRAEVSPSRIAPGHSATATIVLDSHRLRDLGLTQTSVFLGSFLGDKVSADKELTVSTVLLPGFENMTDAQRANAPKMRLSAGSLELGSFKGKTKKKGEIEITNEGRSVLNIRSLQMFTTGLEVSLNKTEIKPGETAKLKVTALAKELKTARSRPRVLMITNDPENTKVVININIQ
ncbi:MAG: DUF1573 domain-containing protein [Prevotella sp.]|nr:DUF1573 domain-containing protein [Prevotella sp.]